MLIEYIKKLFVEKCSASTEVDRPITVVDIGCRWGFADKFLDNSGNLIIYGFDPDVEECERLERAYNSKNIRLVPVALADESGRKNIYLTKEPACSSLYRPIKYLIDANPALDCAREVSQAEVQVTTLDKWARTNRVNNIDYMKIDTQGSELDILKGAKNTLKKVRILEVEVEFNQIYAGQPVFSDVDKFLRTHGFELWKLPNIVHYGLDAESDTVLSRSTVNYDHYRYEVESRGGQVFWADAIYVKKEIIHGDMSSASVKQNKIDHEIADRLGLLDLAARIGGLVQ